MLLLIFINDLSLYLKDPIRSVDLYADDTTLYDNAPDKNTLEKNLQHALNLLNIRCLENGMVINIDKIKLMLISSRQKRNTMKDKYLALIYDDLELQIADCENFLGF